LLPSSAPGGAIAQGSIFRIANPSLHAPAAAAAEFPLQPELSGVRVEIETDEGVVYEAFPLNFFLFRFDLLMPSDVPVGEHSLTFIQGGERTELDRIKVVRTSPGLFTTSSYGRPELAGQDLKSPTARGDRITLWATGLGPIEFSDALPPPVGDLPTEITVTIGDQEAQILYQGRAPCCAGLDQIDVLVPKEAPLGCSVPVWVTAYGSLYSNVATLAIAEPGRACWEAEDELAKPFVEEPTGRALFSRFTEREGDAVQFSYDGRAGFRGPTREGEFSGLLAFRTGYPVPPRGTCAPLQENSGERLGVFGPPYDGFMGLYEGSPLDAGQRFSLDAPLGPSNLTLASSGQWFLYDEGLRSFTANPRVTLLPGPYRLESEGGPGFPAFTADFDLPPAPLWTNQDALAEFPRTNGLLVEWQGGDPADDRLVTLAPRINCPGGDPCIIIGGQPSASFVCRATPGATSLEVPPAFYANETTTAARLQLTNLPRPAEMQFATDGPETGLVVVRDSESVPLSLDLPHLASTPVTLPDGSLVQAELAANSSERQRGLMFRPSLKANGGMLFLFNQSARWSFWMFNTLIPLDIIWLNEDREIIFINRDTPPCPGQPCPTYGPNAVSRSVLELAAGEAARRNLQVGDQLDW